MSATDFGYCLKRYWYIVVALVLVAIGFSCVRFFGSVQAATYTASVTINTNSVVTTLNGVSANLAEECMLEEPGVNAKVTLNDKANTVEVSVTGKDEEKCKRLASEIADNAISEVDKMMPYPSNATYVPFKAQAQAPVISQSGQQSVKAILKNLVIPLMLSLVLSVCLIVAIYMIKRPVIAERDIEQSFGLNAFGIKRDSASDAARLLANIRFSSNEMDLRKVCIIPCSEELAAKEISDLLRDVLKTEEGAIDHSHPDGLSAHDDKPKFNQFKVVCCDTIQASTRTLYLSREADSVVLVARQWKDSMRTLARSIEELRITKASLAGCVLIKD